MESTTYVQEVSNLRDTFAIKNSFTKKELVGRTYAGVEGYFPFADYLGSLGYCLELALRSGVKHSAVESQYFFDLALLFVISFLTLGVRPTA